MPRRILQEGSRTATGSAGRGSAGLQGAVEGSTGPADPLWKVLTVSVQIQTPSRYEKYVILVADSLGESEGEAGLQQNKLCTEHDVEKRRAAADKGQKEAPVSGPGKPDAECGGPRPGGRPPKQ